MSDYFQAKAQDWDKQAQTQQRSQVIGKNILQRIPLNPETKVMDFGAGTGLLSAQIAEHVKEIAAVDVSDAMLAQLQAKTELQNVKTYKQNLLESPLNQVFDLIISAMALHHVKDLQGLLNCFAKHLHSGGYIALADLEAEDGSFHAEGTPGIHHHGFELDDIKVKLQDASFKQIQFETVYKIHKHGKEYPVFVVTAQKS